MSDVIPSDGDKPQDGSPEGHVEKMLAMGDGTGNQDDAGAGDQSGDQVAARPDNVPEKFWDAEKGEINTEALLKSQADAETALRQGKKPEGDEQEPEGDQAADSQDENQASVVADASAEWEQKGELSEETFKALEGAGLSRDMVNDYIAGQQAIVGNLQTAAYNPFEGADGYNKAAEWAANNLDEAEIKALDVQLTSNNPAIVAQGAKALKSKFDAEADVEPNTIRGNSNTPASGGVYHSSREMMKDMNSQKYRTSSAFRDEVAAKLSRSNL